MVRLLFTVLALSLSLGIAAQEVQTATVISLEKALQIALSENTSVKVADKEIERTKYAEKGTYASLFPSVDGMGSYQRTLKKQKMYADMPGFSDGIEFGYENSITTGVSASMPLVNAQLWKSIKISGQDVELAVEKARSSRLQTVTQVKQAYYAVLLAKQVHEVYKSVYENAVKNCELTQKKYNAQKASELDLTRAKTSLANAVPDMYDSESAISLALWQLKAVMGINLDENIDTEGSLMDYSKNMATDIRTGENASLENNSSMRQLAIQAEQLANMVKMQKAAYIPSLALSFSFTYSGVGGDTAFSSFKWSPYSYAGISLSIPIFSGHKRLNQIRQTKVQATELELQRADAERQLKIGIRQYLKSMETAVKTHAAAEDALGTAQKAYSIAQKSYNVGRSTLTDLDAAQLQLTQSQLGVVQAVYSFIYSQASLEEILGTDINVR